MFDLVSEAPIVLLVGAGQLGSRYLQGLARVDQMLRINVVDPSEASLEVAQQRWNDISLAAAHELRFFQALDDVPKQFDLVIVATPAPDRANVVTAIKDRCEVNAWILEKILAQSSQQVDQIQRVLDGHSKVWVNTPRRLMPWHQAIKAKLLASAPPALDVRIFGGNWGLACNAIHFIDLVSWWTGATLDCVHGRRLGDWQPSKRSGFQEVFGLLEANFSDGSKLELHCDQIDTTCQIQVETPDGNWLIDEAAGKALGPSGQEVDGQLIFQSALSAPLVEQILTAGRCELPSLAASAVQHRPLLDALLQHWNHSQSRQDLATPIT